MSRPLLLLGLTLGASALSAQAPRASESVLQHRVKALEARQAALQAQVARRDSLAVDGPDMVVVGKAPLYLKVPGWVGPRMNERVVASVDSWTVRVGPLFTRAPAETVSVAFRSDTSGWTAKQIGVLLDLFPEVVRFRAARASEARVQRALGERFIEWLGPTLPSGDPSRDRREAIVSLMSDTTGVGRRCLDGDRPSCLSSLRRSGPPFAGPRRSLLGYLLQRAGPEGWSRLTADTTGSPEARVSALAGVPYDAAVAAWIQELRSPADDAPTVGLGSVAEALLWAVLLSLLFAWSIAWIRA